MPAAAEQNLRNGFTAATKAVVLNAIKRERVMAATVKVANAAIENGRTVVILGDFNTGYEFGKFGNSIKDCTVTDFSCARGPFPKTACQGSDGYDDTLGILEEGLVGKNKWSVLSRGLGRTYDNPIFSDHAIDHIAVPTKTVGKFTKAQRASQTFGSDHYPIWTTCTDQ